MPAAFRKVSEVCGTFYQHFPDLANTRWLLKSPWNDDYQCIAWAACKTDVLWWPATAYWPPGASLDVTVEAFTEAFATIGYRECSSAAFEFGYQKVAIYAMSTGTVTHMARQHFFGRGWLSKCGQLEDILHPTLESLEGDPSPVMLLNLTYGEVSRILKRGWWAGIKHGCLLRCVRTAFNFWLYRLSHPSWIWHNLKTSLGRN